MVLFCSLIKKGKQVLGADLADQKFEIAKCDIKKMEQQEQHPTQIIERTKQAIRTLRGNHVILDTDLAEIFGVATRRLNEQVKRNPGKFPEDFRFQLNPEEFESLKSQIATSKRGGTRKAPYAFTEHGVLQAANVITSPLADSMSVFVIRAFVEMRDLLQLQQGIADQRAKAEAATPVASGKLRQFMTEIGPKLEQAMQQVMNTVIDPQSGTTVGQEAQDVIHESINHLKARLKKTGLENEEIAARITKLLAEAEREKAETRKLNAETDQMEFFMMARKLKLVLEAHRLFALDGEEAPETQRLNAFIGLLGAYGEGQ